MRSTWCRPTSVYVFVSYNYAPRAADMSTYSISAIMVNRITLNLKRESYKRSLINWSSKTFEYSHRHDETVDTGSVCLTSVELASEGEIQTYEL